MASCSGIARFVLVLLNLLLFIIGALLIVAGILTIFVPNAILSEDILNHSDDLRIVFDSTYLMVAAWVVVGLGVVIVVVSLCGCLGSAFMSKVLLGIFIFVVLQIILVQVGIGVLIILSPTWFESSAEDTLELYVSQHPENPLDPPEDKTTETIGWNFLQYSVGCCGINGVTDYENVTNVPSYFVSCCVVADKSEAALLSLSTAAESTKTYNYTNEANCISQIGDPSLTEREHVNDVGCIEELYSNLMIYGIAAIAVVAIQIFIVIIACIVCCSANRDEKPI